MASLRDALDFLNWVSGDLRSPANVFDPVTGSTEVRLSARPKPTRDLLPNSFSGQTALDLDL